MCTPKPVNVPLPRMVPEFVTVPAPEKPVQM
jgi:hypothetical protein